MRTSKAFAGQAVLRPLVAGLLFICGCETGPSAPSDLSAVGGLPSSGGSTGTGGGSGGAVASGGAVGSGGAASGGGGGASGGAGASGGTAGAASGGGTGSGGAAGPTFALTSPAFDNDPACAVDNLSACAVFPDENVSYLENANVSPELSWTGTPAGTGSFALVLMDVTFGQAHWVVWNIPADVALLTAGVPQDAKLLVTPAGAEQANANFATTSEDGYFGPHVPCNVFAFQLYALPQPSFAPTDPDSAVLVAIELQELEDVLGVATLTGRANDYDMTCQ